MNEQEHSASHLMLQRVINDPCGCASPSQPLLPDMSKSGSHPEAVSERSECLEHHREKSQRGAQLPANTGDGTQIMTLPTVIIYIKTMNRNADSVRHAPTLLMCVTLGMSAVQRQVLLGCLPAESVLRGEGEEECSLFTPEDIP